MKPKFLLCLVLVLSGGLFGCVTTQHAVVKERTLENVTFKVSLPGQNAPARPIPVHLKIENDRSKAIALDWWERSTSIQVKSAEGKDVPRSKKASDVFMSPGSRTTAVLAASAPQPHGMLHPGRSVETTIDLGLYFQLVPGNYSLTVSNIVWPVGPSREDWLELRVESIPFEVGP